MNIDSNLQPLINHLNRSSGLSQDEARKIITEVIAFMAEDPEDFVRRRHAEIKRETGLSNPQIFERIESEVKQRVFSTRPLTQRQIRRMIYG